MRQLTNIQTDRHSLLTAVKPKNKTCPSCSEGALVCPLCDYEAEIKPIPPTLSNRDAFALCACPACDGGIMECDACGYTFNSIKGYKEGVF
jgi:hypothetical protein